MTTIQRWIRHGHDRLHLQLYLKANTIAAIQFVFSDEFVEIEPSPFPPLSLNELVHAYESA